ncbi:MAG: T9SS type A sorting domain-containing protein [Sporocytophaga sp.]|uniref:ELWxxDGT repeat protein n=1 Tax=Sporocytophaga sp. TaxID=2231183 RepID=UPI001B09C68B|nr:ELWxxDGT repeat protein [Sporocytophaga sp.]MBO9702839.1 T9SS type A sorting domain-containing protein [Sporocytophaga sp.]
MKKLFTTLFFIFFCISFGISQSLFKSFNPSGDSYPYFFFEFKDELYFIANDGTDAEIWKTDGTATGTKLLKDINPSGPSNPDDVRFIQFNSEFYFSAYDSYGQELWKSDGTTEGTVRVSDINQSGSSYPNNLTAFNSELYFSAFDGTGTYLFKTNGTAITKVSDVQVGHYEMAVYNSMLYFGGIDPQNNIGLYKTNGNIGEESLVKQTTTGESSSSPYDLKVLNNKLYFSAEHMNAGIELWVSDGTNAGTNAITSGNKAPSQLTLLNGTIFFSAINGEEGRELWKTDGTLSGTELVKDVNPTSSSGVTELTIFNSELYFIADDGSHGFELWKSNGTEVGTIMVKDINPSGDGDPFYLTVYNGQLYFGANDGTLGAELWKSDGSEDGTVLVMDINQGANESDPGDFHVFKNALYFSADNGTDGFELWKFSNVTGIKDKAISDAINIYPNPAYQYCDIDLKYVKNITSISVMNSLNQLVKQVKVSASQNRIETEDLPVGLYHIILTDSDNNIYSKKLIKN